VVAAQQRGLHLLVGMVAGLPALGLFGIDAIRDAGVLEAVTEIAIIVSLFTTGLRLRIGWGDAAWRVPVLLASGAMVVTVALLALLGARGSESGASARSTTWLSQPSTDCRWSSPSGSRRSSSQPSPVRFSCTA
jgi:hypothetical protein